MKRYRSHKIVEAAPIWNFTKGDRPHDAWIVGTPGETHVVPAEVFARGTPSTGDYLVRYADGYLSWSPKAAFEEGYTLVDEDEHARRNREQVELIRAERPDLLP